MHHRIIFQKTVFVQRSIVIIVSSSSGHNSLKKGTYIYFHIIRLRSNNFTVTVLNSYDELINAIFLGVRQRGPRYLNVD